MKENLDLIEKVYPLFHKIGAKNLTMDEVSEACGISKKTLYQYFPNKEILLKNVIEYTQENIENIIQAVKARNLSAIEELYAVMDAVYETLQTDDDIFVYQLSKYYPKLYEICDSDIFEIIYQHLMDNLNKGMDEGVYELNEDKDLLIRFFIANIKLVKTSDIFTDTQKTKKELSYFFLNNFICSIYTDKGKEYFNQMKPQYEI